MILAASQLSVTFGPTTVVDRLDLTLRGDRAVGLVGVSGSGKTTVARALAGFVAPSAGRVDIDGVTLPARRTAVQRRRVQLVFQDAAGSLDPRATAATTIGRAVSRRADRERMVRLLMAAVALPAELAGARPAELSGGQAQRVALARALACEPDFLLCDEVTSALDPQTEVVVLDALVELQRTRRLGLLVISHDPAVIDRVCDHVVELQDGRVL